MSGGIRSGQPIIVMGSILVAWSVIRIAAWESPFPAVFEPARTLFGETIATAPIGPMAMTENEPLRERSWSFAGPTGAIGQSKQLVRDTGAPNAALVGLPLIPPSNAKTVSSFARDRSAVSAAPVLPLPGGLPPRAAIDSDSWSLDAYLFLRDGSSDRTVTGPTAPNYGSNQAGAILRYKLDRDSDHRPTAFVRATTALAGPSQSDLSVGLSARPFPRIPISVWGEARLSRSGDRTEMRPAAFAVSEIPPVDLPLKMRAGIYGQAGYVGGDFATVFVDGQARIDRPVLRVGKTTLRAGIGAWGGAQKGTGRLDVGPGIQADVTVAQTPLRIALDYRERVVGNANPPSGVALTVSTGF